MVEPREQWLVKILDGGDLRAAFVIDGRDYADPADAEAVSDEAFAELGRRRIPAEFEVRQVGPAEPRRRLPSWEEYRRRFDTEPVANGD